MQLFAANLESELTLAKTLTSKFRSEAHALSALSSLLDTLTDVEVQMTVDKLVSTSPVERARYNTKRFIYQALAKPAEAHGYSSEHVSINALIMCIAEASSTAKDVTLAEVLRRGSSFLQTLLGAKFGAGLWQEDLCHLRQMVAECTRSHQLTPEADPSSLSHRCGHKHDPAPPLRDTIDDDTFSGSSSSDSGGNKTAPHAAEGACGDESLLSFFSMAFFGAPPPRPPSPAAAPAPLGRRSSVPRGVPGLALTLVPTAAQEAARGRAEGAVARFLEEEERRHQQRVAALAESKAAAAAAARERLELLRRQDEERARIAKGTHVRMIGLDQHEGALARVIALGRGTHAGQLYVRVDETGRQLRIKAEHVLIEDEAPTRVEAPGSFGRHQRPLPMSERLLMWLHRALPPPLFHALRSTPGHQAGHGSATRPTISQSVMSLSPPAPRSQLHRLKVRLHRSCNTAHQRETLSAYREGRD